jgi:hypothetical protein
MIIFLTKFQQVALQKALYLSRLQVLYEAMQALVSRINGSRIIKTTMSLTGWLKTSLKREIKRLRTVRLLSKDSRSSITERHLALQAARKTTIQSCLTRNMTMRVVWDLIRPQTRERLWVKQEHKISWITSLQMGYQQGLLHLSESISRRDWGNFHLFNCLESG